jgi:hypothetical protein
MVEMADDYFGHRDFPAIPYLKGRFKKIMEKKWLNRF